MPKKWEQFKGEIRQLYMVEKRPLNEVRGILDSKHGFKASTRMFRIKLDEWGFRKNSSRKANSHSRRRRRSPRSISVDRRPDNDPLLDPVCGLEAILSKWRADSNSMQLANSWLDKHYQTFDIAAPVAVHGTIFKMIEDKVGSHECHVLTTACLRADLKKWRGPYSSRSPPWLLDTMEYESHWKRAWRIAQDKDWMLAKTDMRTMLHPNGGTFSECGLVLIAEKNLGELKNHLESNKHRTVSERGNSFQAECKLYIEILKEFQNSKLDVSPSWYKYGLQVAEWKEGQVENSLRQENRVLKQRLILTQVKKPGNREAITAKAKSSDSE